MSELKQFRECPVCHKPFRVVDMPDHLESAGEDHADLFNHLDSERNEAYFTAEVEWVLDKCPPAKSI